MTACARSHAVEKSSHIVCCWLFSDPFTMATSGGAAFAVVTLIQGAIFSFFSYNRARVARVAFVFMVR